MDNEDVGAARRLDHPTGPAPWEARMIRGFMRNCPHGRPADRCCRRAVRRFERRMERVLADAIGRVEREWEV